MSRSHRHDFKVTGHQSPCPMSLDMWARVSKSFIKAIQWFESSLTEFFHDYFMIQIKSRNDRHEDSNHWMALMNDFDTRARVMTGIMTGMTSRSYAIGFESWNNHGKIQLIIWFESWKNSMTGTPVTMPAHWLILPGKNIDSTAVCESH